MRSKDEWSGSGSYGSLVNVSSPRQADSFARSKYRSFKRVSKGKDSRRLSAPLPISELCLSTLSPKLLAGQLTLLDMPLFRAIPQKELLSCQWNCKLKQNKSPHIVAFIAHFNQVCYWLVREVLTVDDVKTRADRISYCIELASELLDLCNINGMKAVLSALGSQPVHRLTQTWAELSKKDLATFQRHNNLLSDEDNKATLRRYMENVCRPCIPFLGMYLTDMVMLNTMQQEQGGSRQQQMQELAAKIAFFQESSYDDIEESVHVLEFIRSQRYLDEMQMFEEDLHYKMSLALEPSEMQHRQPDVDPLLEDMWRSSANSKQPAYVRTSHSVRPALLSRSVSLNTPCLLTNHRRTKSSCDKATSNGLLFALSVIAPEATPGPRHLIDGSLMSSTASMESESTGSSCSGRSTSVPDLAACAGSHVLGATVSLSESDDGETLLAGDSESADSDSSGGPRHAKEWKYPTLSGFVQIKRLTLKPATMNSSPEAFPPVSQSLKTSGSFRTAALWARSWKTSAVRMCANQLGFFAVHNNKSGRRRPSSEPFCVIDLQSHGVSIVVQRARTITINITDKKSIIMRTSCEAERDEWLSALTDAIQKYQTSEDEPAAPLIEFE